MKNYLQHNNFKNLHQHLMQWWTQGVSLSALLFASMLLPATAISATVNLATVPLATATTTSVLPNLMFTLDDSGSMDSNYLPDWANDAICKGTTGSYNSNCSNQPPYRSSDFNAIYYNPAIRYTPAMNADGSSKASQTSWTSVKNDAYNIQDTGSTNLVSAYTDVEWCTDNTYTDCLRNDNYILPGTVNSKAYTTSRPSVKSTGSGFAATGSPLPPTGSPPQPTTVARSWGPHYYTIIPGEYCDSIKLTNCQTTATATVSYPVKVRWCNSSANSTAANPVAGSCQAVRKSGFTNARYPTKFFNPAVPANPGQPFIAATPAVAPANGTLVMTAVARNKTISLRCGSTFIGQSNTFTSSNNTTASTRLNSLHTSINNSTVNGYGFSCTKSPNTTSPTSISCTISAPAGVSACSSGFNVDSDITATNNTGPAGGANAVSGQAYIAPTPAQAA
ncbi:MAG: hypothetical protein U1A04_02420, partial [Moraxellaceae bacterium]|nr:hypothetical protein [Moraxellaceae bacterium]